MVRDPVKPAMAGKDRADLEDPTGLKLCSEMVGSKTQQNAALVEQSATAAESLKEQRLAGVVRTFRLQA